MSNIPPFQIGDKVVYITGIHMPKGTIHIVTDVYLKPCGCWSINIKNDPLKTVAPDALFYRCTTCNNKYPANPRFYSGWAASSFRPVQEQKFPLISYSKVLEEVVVGAN